MNDQIQLEGITESIYGGFWLRLGALFLDLLITSPLMFLFLYLNHSEKNMYFYTISPYLLFQLWYNVYLPKKYGGTPGKLIAGIKIIRINGGAIGWKESVLRYCYYMVLMILSTLKMIICLSNADSVIYASLSWTKQTRYLTSISPQFSKFYMLSSLIWMFSEIITLLSNKRKRSVHDYIANTVVVKTKYIDKLNDTLIP